MIFCSFYTVNVKAKHWKRCYPSKDKRCEKSFDILSPYHPSHEFTRFSGHLVTHINDSLLANYTLTPCCTVVHTLYHLFFSYFRSHFSTLMFKKKFFFVLIPCVMLNNLKKNFYNFENV